MVNASAKTINHLICVEIFFVLKKYLTFFPNKPWFLRVCTQSLLKTLWEKEKLLVTSNFSFSHSVSTLFENFLPFSSNLKLVSSNSFSSEESKFVVWERVNMPMDHFTSWTYSHILTDLESNMPGIFLIAAICKINVVQENQNFCWEG